MSQGDKARFYNALKSAGVNFTKHYREYNTAELKEAWDRLQAAQPAPEQPAPHPEQGYNGAPGTEPQFDPTATAAAYAAMAQAEEPARQEARQLLDERQQPSAPVAPKNPDEMAGVRQNSQSADEPIRTDEQGRVWYQEEVLKPAYPKPRGRRVLKYMDTGVRKETVRDGKYVEEFEVAGDLPSRPAEVKITLPSYQVGIYKDRRFPFKIHTYNGRQGFDLFEVQNYYGGAELVPMEIKKVYVENVLCYDIRTTVRAIQTEYRQLQLQGKA